MKVYFYDMISGEYQSTAELASDEPIDQMVQTTMAPPVESSDYVYDRIAGLWSLKVTEPTNQDLINSELLKTTAQLQLDNAALLKEIAAIKAGGES